MFTRLEEDMDINCGKILDGLVDVQQMGQEIFEHILRTASGEKSKSELLNLGDNEFVPWHLGIVSWALKRWRKNKFRRKMQALNTRECLAWKSFLP